MNHAHPLSLVTPTSTTPPIVVPDGIAAKLTIDINDSSATTWGSAVVDLQFSAVVGHDSDGTLLDNWQNFNPVVQFTSTTKARRSIGVTGSGNVRLHVSTAASAADKQAMVTIRTSWNA